MTDEQINAAIAEAFGWRKVYEGPEPDDRMIDPSGNYSSKRHIPNYCNDLNAMHEIEKLFDPPSTHWQFYATLSDLCGSPIKAISAPARPRAEAFLRTLGKWEEVQG